MRGKFVCHRATIVGLTFLAVLLLTIAGCGGGGGGGGEITPTPTPSPASVIGYVTRDVGGEAVADIEITATETERKTRNQTVSGEDGSYSLSLTPGVYDITTNLTGYGQTRIQDLEAASGDDLTVNLPVLPIYSVNWAVVAPVITSVTGLPTSSNVSGTYNVTIETSSPNAIRTIEMRISNRNSVPDFRVNDSSTMQVSWDTSIFPPPPDEFYIHITVLDVNNNRTEKTIHIGGQATSTTLSAPGSFSAIAYTVPYEYLSFRDDYMEATGCSLEFFHQQVMKLPEAFVMSPKTAPAGTNLFSILTWNQVNGADGYRVYRQEGTGGNYQLVGSTAAGDYTQFVDRDPQLAPGKTYYYQVAAYNSQGIGQTTTAPSVTPLEYFTVANISPAHNQTGVSLNPAYSWAINNEVGSRQEYLLWVLGQNDSSLTYQEIVINSTSVSDAVLLENNTLYNWGIINAVALGSYHQGSGSYKAVSIGLVEGLSAFTTEK